MDSEAFFIVSVEHWKKPSNIQLGFYLDWRSANLQKWKSRDKLWVDVLLEHLGSETDGPYLSPHPHRGKRNQPAFINYVVDKLAEINPSARKKLLKITSANARKLFRL